ncbi:MAG: hypothetical protein ABR545_07220 [Cyclonatronaceae bacterium]
MKNVQNKTILWLVALLFTAGTLTACDTIFGTKNDAVTDEIFEEGRQDPDLIVEEVGYAALVPFWDGFDRPTDITVGFDELVYVTDSEGVHVLDRSGRRYQTIPLRGAVAVVQDRLLNLYVSARYDTVITAVDPGITWDLAAVYKIRNANGAGDLQIVDILVHPFMDASRSTTISQRSRLDRSRVDNDELVEVTGVAVLANNDIYVSRRGPRNQAGQAVAADNTVLIYTENRDNQGNRLGTMRNTTQIRTLNPNTPSLLSAVSINDIATFIAPPQRDSFTPDLNFLVAQGAPDRDIPFRVLWINAVQTPDGLEYRSNPTLLARDTTRADSFLYDQNKFRNPTGLAYTADARAQLLVVDAATDSLYLFQSNGIEGINPLPGSQQTKAINVSFGGKGNGPRQFDEPSGVAYFNRVVYVADKNNNRIARYKLNTDFE